MLAVYYFRMTKRVFDDKTLIFLVFRISVYMTLYMPKCTDKNTIKKLRSFVPELWLDMKFIVFYFSLRNTNLLSNVSSLILLSLSTLPAKISLDNSFKIRFCITRFKGRAPN